MRIFLALLAAWLVVGAPGIAAAEPLPKAVADIIDVVANDPAALKTVVAAAKKANPGSTAEIDAHVAALTTRTEAAKTARMASLRPLEGWTGEVELGGFLSTGNTDENGIAAGVKFNKTTLRLRHLFEFTADYKRTDDVVTKEKYFGVYTVNYKLGERYYAWGRLSAERDQFAGFDARLSEGVGLGYRVIDAKDLKLDIEGGPALRQTDYTGGGRRRSVAARLAQRLAWQISEDVRITQSAATFLESGNSTFVASAGVTTKLGSAISARASFDLRHDQNPPNDRQKTDTTSRITLDYDF
jgi:putative salt-induced outer membrane protein